MKCDIIVLVWNKKEVTRDCIESIARNTRFPYRLIIIDNASQEPTRRYLESLKSDSRFELTLIRNEENLGNTKGVNQGLKASSAEFACNLNNDTVVTDGWLEEMVAIAQGDKSIGLVVPALDTKGLAKNPSIEEIEAYARKRLKHKGEYVELGIASGFCLLIKREVIERIGMWNEIFSPGYFDDTEYVMRTQRSGFIAVLSKAAFVYHREHSSFKDRNREKIFSRNRDIFHSMYAKPKRVLYIVDKPGERTYGLVKERALDLARKANWVWIFRKGSLPSLGMREHGSVRHFVFSPSLFWLISLYRVLTRKKKFDSIYVLGPGPKGIFKSIRFIHKACVEELV